MYAKNKEVLKLAANAKQRRCNKIQYANASLILIYCYSRRRHRTYEGTTARYLHLTTKFDFQVRQQQKRQQHLNNQRHMSTTYTYTTDENGDQVQDTGPAKMPAYVAKRLIGQKRFKKKGTPAERSCCRGASSSHTGRKTKQGKKIHK